MICCHVGIIDHTDGIIDHPDGIIGCVDDIIDHVHELIDSTADIFNDFIESYPHGSWKLPTKMLRYFPYFSWRDHNNNPSDIDQQDEPKKSSSTHLAYTAYGCCMWRSSTTYRTRLWAVILNDWI